MRQPQLHERLRPLTHCIGALQGQVELVVANPYRHDLAVIAEIHEGVSRALLHLSGQVGTHVVAVEMDVVLLATDRGAVQELLGHVRVAGGREQRREHVDVGDDAVQDRTRLDLAGPAHEARHTPAAFPVRVLLAAERGVGAVRPGVVLRAVVGRVLDDGVVGDAQLVELGEHHANLLVVDDHAIAVGVLPALAEVLLGHVGAEVHRRGVVPEEEGLVRLDLLLHPFNRAGRDFLVDGLHPFLRQGAGVCDLLFAHPSPSWSSVGRPCRWRRSGARLGDRTVFLNAGSLG